MMGDKKAYKQAIEKLSKNNLAVLATASKSGIPNASTIEFVMDDENLYFVTKETYTKYKNIKENPIGTIVITSAPESIQLDGEIIEIKGDEIEFVSNLLTSKLGQNVLFYKKEPWKFLKFIPKEARFSKYPKMPSRFENKPE